MEKISKEEFIRKLQDVKTATSVTGIVYKDITVSNGYITGIRSTTNNTFKIKIDNLYSGYKELEEINTNTLKDYVKNRVQSPALAILNKIGLV
ncbi:MAG: hypothetical protein J6P44_03985 [Bacteroidales bacterium]|nr:hypothetical protein [Bacteroidales bacterium]